MTNSRANRWAAAIAITVPLVAISSFLAAQWLNDSWADGRKVGWLVPPKICIILVCIMSEWLSPAAMHPQHWVLRSVGRGGLIGTGLWLVMMRLVKRSLEISWVEFFPIFGLLYAPIAFALGAVVCVFARSWFSKLRRSQE